MCKTCRPLSFCGADAGAIVQGKFGLPPLPRHNPRVGPNLFQNSVLQPAKTLGDNVLAKKFE